MMRPKMFVALGIAVGLLGGRPPVQAATPVQVEGQLRVRATADARDFDRDTDPLSYTEMQTRVGVKAAPQENLSLFVQVQDSRTLGAVPGTSGGLANDVNLGLHQAYLDYDLGGGFGIRAGRFEMVFGNHRLVGNVGWDNVGRTWDGMMVTLATESVRWDLFGAIVDETAFATRAPDRDREFGGLNVSLKDQQVELFAFFDRDQVPRPAPGTKAQGDETERDNRRATLGTYSARSLGSGLDYIFNGAYQLGRFKSTVVDTASPATDPLVEREIDLGAFLVSLETGYTLTGAGQARLAFLADYASGDDGRDPGKFKGFNNLYYTGHKFRGAMDYFVAPHGFADGDPRGALGLVDLALRFSVKAGPRWTLSADLHHFSTAQDYPAGTDRTARSLGREIDLGAAFKDGAFGFVAGASGFSAADDAARAGFGGPDDAFWGYTMLTAGF